jgi:hypothetical protein
MNTESKASQKIHPLLRAKEQLEKRLLEHERFGQALDRIRTAILFPTDAKLLFIIGPTGVGKSRLFRKAQSEVIKILGESLLEDKERIPHVAFEVPDVQIGNFNWKSFYHAYLDELRLPLLPNKELLGELPRVSPDKGWDYVLMRALEHRRPAVTFLDEANHLCQVTSGQLLRHQMDKIKSLANRSNVLHICFGTYDLARLINLSSQLARRSEIFHFSRYRAESREDMNNFEAAVGKFQPCLPIAHNIDLRTQVKFLHENTIGCVGTLKTWLMEALAHAYREKRTEISLDDLRETTMPLSRLQKMLSDAKENEGFCDETKEDRDLYLTTLGHNDTPESGLPGINVPPPPRSPRSVAERNPHRDPIGGGFSNHGVRRAG